jgi:hypothetical protein
VLRNIRAAFIDFGLFQLGPVHSTVVNLVLTLLVTVLVAFAIGSLIGRERRAVSAFILLALCLPMLLLVARDLVSGGGLVNQSRYFTPLYLGIELAIVAFFRSALSGRTAAARAWQAALIALLVGGAVSCAISSQAQTWANKDYERNRAVAQLVNGSHAPLVMSEFPSSRVLGLGYYLDPDVGLRVAVRCVRCSFATAEGYDMLAGVARAGTIFLLGPSPELQRQVQRAAARWANGAQLRVIGVNTFPAQANELALFAPM